MASNTPLSKLSTGWPRTFSSPTKTGMSVLGVGRRACTIGLAGRQPSSRVRAAYCPLRGDAWFLRENDHGLRLMTGRLLACEVARSKLRVSVIGPIGDDVRGTLGAEIEKDEEFKKVPGGLLLTFPIEHAAEALDLLKDE